jgi:hypothetical protein
MNTQFLSGLGLVAIGQVLVFLQTNLQFISPKVKEHTYLLAFVGGGIISLIFMKGIGLIVQSSGGQIWPSRIIPSALGTVLFAILTWLMFRESINPKTAVCVALSFIIIAIQVLWKD